MPSCRWRTNGEYKRVEQLALRQQYTGRTAYVKGKLAVTGVGRVRTRTCGSSIL